jgi:hypothetical protein
MSKKEKAKEHQQQEVDVKEPTKDDVNGHRNPNKKKRDYDKRYGEKEGYWN